MFYAHFRKFSCRQSRGAGPKLGDQQPDQTFCDETPGQTSGDQKIWSTFWWYGQVAKLATHNLIWAVEEIYAQNLIVVELFNFVLKF